MEKKFNLKKWLSSEKMTIQHLSKQSGMSESAIRNLIRGGTVSLLTVEQISRVIDEQIPLREWPNKIDLTRRTVRQKRKEPGSLKDEKIIGYEKLREKLHVGEIIYVKNERSIQSDKKVPAKVLKIYDTYAMLELQLTNIRGRAYTQKSGYTLNALVNVDRQKERKKG